MANCNRRRRQKRWMTTACDNHYTIMLAPANELYYICLICYVWVKCIQILWINVFIAFIKWQTPHFEHLLFDSSRLFFKPSQFHMPHKSVGLSYILSEESLWLEIVISKLREGNPIFVHWVITKRQMISTKIGIHSRKKRMLTSL